MPRPIRGAFVCGAAGHRPDLFVYRPSASAQLSPRELPAADVGGLSAALGRGQGKKPNPDYWFRAAADWGTGGIC